ncbi:alpha-1,2-fucosyltransferase [Candidatus Parcubacteria bacterium]|jgi:hypothetical protein|nr:MAG: alpha-1,2-fucosyltransferase [Candidatus Parcubacteria bacterium]
MKGGLGNQLFQYALGRHLSILNKTKLRIDISFYYFQTDKLLDHRTPCLQYFNLAFETKKHSKILYPISLLFYRLKSLLIRKYCRIREQIFTDKLGKYIIREDFNFDPRILQLKDNVNLDGYWQNEKYFIEIQDILRQEIRPKEELLKDHIELINRIQNCNSVSLHVRRSDKTRTKIHITCKKYYYDTAIERICTKVSKPNFYVFSDDIEWVKQKLKIPEPVHFVSEIIKKDYLELYLMSLCKYHIISNSSFSWWGAWLSANPNKVVISPKEWYNSKYINEDKLGLKDLIPVDWIRISNWAE